VALPTNQPIAPARNQGDLMRVDNLEQAFHPLYNYAYITDAQQGLILTDVNTLSDQEPRNNYLHRALTWNPNGVLNGARHLTIGGSILYITTPHSVVIVSIDNPLQPKVLAEVPLPDPRSTALQFRYLFVTDAKGLEVIDVTHPESPQLTPNNTVPISAANRVYVARTYAYVAAGPEGLVIVDVTRPTAMNLDTVRRYNADGKLRDAKD